VSLVPADIVVSMRGVTKVYRPTPRIMRVLVRTSIYADVVALDGVDLELAAGRTLALVGPNGAGKTTIFRIMTGLTPPTTGTVHVLGVDAVSEPQVVRRSIGFMPAEDRSLFMRMSCVENLLFHARLQHLPRREMRAQCLDMLDQVGLSGQAHNSVFALSAGMRARLQLARALLHRPKLLILDEPTGAVDPVGAHELLELVQRMVRDLGLAALISSHRLEEIEALGSNVVLLDHGRLRYHGSLDDLRAHWQRPFVELEFAAPAALSAAAALLQGSVVEATPVEGRLLCHLSSGSTTGDLLHQLGPLAHELAHVRETPTPLRDILAQIYSQGSAELEEVG
jgi:ABC-2 type transport system ATP-binding protein